VPIGYWAFDVSGGEPFIQGQITYLWKSIVWAQAHGLKVVVDLHGEQFGVRRAHFIVLTAF
jgi:glucan 1,3-beta-glucosidase